MAQITVKSIREKYPQYNSLSDQELADRLHEKFYSKMPKEEYYKKIGHEPVDPNSFKAFKEELHKALVGTGRGFMDVGEGSAQLISSALEKSGIVPEGVTESFTKKRDTERKFYESTPYGKSETGQIHRLLGNLYPYIIPGAEAISGETLPAKMASGATTGGAMGLMQYVPEGADRAENVVLGTALGGAAPVVPALASAIKTLRTKIDPRSLVKMIQEGHDTLKNKASGLYNSISEAFKERNIAPIPITSEIKKTISDISKLMPKTKANNLLIKNAKSGDYDAWHKLQSDAGIRARKFESSPTAAENDIGELLHDKRDDLIEHAMEHFKSSGHTDLAENWQEARKTYNKMKQLYYPKGNRTIGRIVHEDTREIPSNPMNLLTKESKPIENLLNEHPELKSAVDTYKKQQEIKGKLTKFGLPTIGAGAVGGTFGPSLFRMIFGDHS